MSNTLNDIFAHLDSAKASRAYEANQERRRKVEEAEHERKVKQAAESAVEKYHVYDDDYDVEDVEEPLVMIPKQNPGTPEAKAATMPASKKDMDDIADNNPFVQNLFKRSHKQVRQERPAREKLAASTNTAKAPQTLAAPASEPTAPQSETFNVPVTPVPVQPVAPSAPASTVAPAVPETVDTVDFVDDIPLDIEFDDTEADIQNKQPDQSVQNEAVPEMQYQNEPVQQGYDTQMNAPADMPAQDIPAPLAQDPAAEQNASDKKQMFHKGKGKDKKNAPADKKRGKAKAAPAEVQGEGFDGNMPVEKPKKKSKAGVIVAVVLAAVIGGGALGYAYVPAVYDGVNNVLTAVTGKQVGVPAPIPSNTGDGNAPTVSQPQLQQSSGTSENALNGIDLSGDVTIEFYATVRTADGREYKVPLSSANLTDGNLKSLLDGSGFTLTSGQ